MKHYHLYKHTVELNSTQTNEMKEGCSQLNTRTSPVLLSSFETEAEALEALSTYSTEILEYDSCCMSIYDITEYYVQKDTLILKYSPFEF